MVDDGVEGVEGFHMLESLVHEIDTAERELQELRDTTRLRIVNIG